MEHQCVVKRSMMPELVRPFYSVVYSVKSETRCSKPCYCRTTLYVDSAWVNTEVTAKR